MNRFLQAVERARLVEHEEKIDSTPGKELPKAGEGHHEKSPFAAWKAEKDREVRELGDRVRGLRLQGLTLQSIVNITNKTERQVLYAEQLWKRRVERDGKRLHRRVFNE